MLIILPTDGLLFALVIASVFIFYQLNKQEYYHQVFSVIWHSRIAAISMAILLSYLLVALCDSIHYLKDNQVYSLLDYLLSSLTTQQETTYTAPFTLLTSSSLAIIYQVAIIFCIFTGVLLLLIGSFIYVNAVRTHSSFKNYGLKILQKKEYQSVWLFVFALSLIVLVCTIFYVLSWSYHVLGTDRIGRDILYESIKSIRTGMILATLSTLLMLPFAISLGLMAGYFKGAVDDIVQYVYTTLSSVPAVLLIAAAILSLQIFVVNHPGYFRYPIYQADARLLGLCAILGLMNWTTLCRLLRGETLKQVELGYVQSAKALGVSNIVILWRHILPNVLHIVVIVSVLNFSALVLAEAVLSYIGIGVDPSTFSWGNMINAARTEISRDPPIWSPFISALSFMFVLVFAANLLADVVRDAFDPKQVRIT